MSTTTTPCQCLLLIIFLTSSSLIPLAASYHIDHEDNEQLKTFIVFVSKPDKPSVFVSHHEWYISTLASLPQPYSSSSSNLHQKPQQILYTYDHAIHGFAARLTLSQASHLRNVRGIVSVLPEKIHKLQTTRTPQFLGLNDQSGIWPESSYGHDVIIGIIDSGIWPERVSFHDDGLPPVPERWKGICEVGHDFPKESCNKKIIGARAFHKGYEAFLLGSKMNVSAVKKISARDTNGHGTHVASIAAGSQVSGASFGPYAAGVASGIAPLARIAVYKVCWPGRRYRCPDADILSAIEMAIKDGVDVISVSIGGTPLPYYENPVMIGAFHAMQKGIFVSCAANNNGPGRNTVGNVAPWVLTVGASTLDREFPANVVLGDHSVLPGVSLFYSDNQLSEYYSLATSKFCESGRMNPKRISGKIVVCDSDLDAEAGYAVKLAGGIGVILVEDETRGEGLTAVPHLIPGTTISYKNGLKIREYIRASYKANKIPVAKIVFKGTTITSSPSSPKVAAFSGRGRNLITPEILKPDIVAPGVNILAAWTGAVGPSGMKEDPRRVEFNVLSGTSMACPHASGIAALIKSVNPTWSPGVIKSVMMTTAYNLDSSGNNITDLSDGKYATPFDMGSGHLNPNKIMDPGLVYPVESEFYEDFLCSINYSPDMISGLFTHTEVDCNGPYKLQSPGDLNYPSFSVVFKPGINTVEYTRSVSNVGVSPNAVYEVKINSPPFVEITVSPPKLVFSTEIRWLSYRISFSSMVVDDIMGVTGFGAGKDWDFGSIEWTDGEHNVRSPIAFIWEDASSSTSTSLTSSV